MRLEKLPIFKKLLDSGIKPTAANFESALVAEIKSKIAVEVDWKYVSPETKAYVDQIAQLFASKMGMDWRSKTKVCTLFSLI